MTHVAKDLTVVGLLSLVGIWLYAAQLPLPVALVAWPVFWFVQGTFMTGLWVLAHECGHQAFSPSKSINNAVGWVLHSALLVPYHSWRISHGNHHKNTCSMEDDEVFVPAVKSSDDRKEVSEVAHAVHDAPLFQLIEIINMLLFGWPLYLTLNVAGPAKYKGQPNSHFNPHAVLFKPSQVFDIIVSNVGMILAGAVIAASVMQFGWQKVVFYYGVPYLVVNSYLVLITYLQHTATYIPHYRAAEFSWLRGALSTVDRTFGWPIDQILHHITDTHVVHHLFHTMPFYHAQEATEAVKPLLGAYYLRDDTPVPAALWHSWTHCKFVDSTGDILHFKAK